MKKTKKRSGRKRPADADLVISQVKAEFHKQMDRLGGAKEAADQLGVCRASFYKYLKGETLPDFEVLRKAHNVWGIKWKYIDTSEILPIRRVQTPEQAVFSFLRAMNEDSVEITQVGTEGATTFNIKLKVTIPA
jgi:transcriptional regulator with XRE-family HTH domain